MLLLGHLGVLAGVSEGRVSQVMRSLVDTWDLIERHGRRGETRYTLSDGGICHVAHRDRAQLPPARYTWTTVLMTDHRSGRSDTWARQTRHADAVTWFLSELESATRLDASSRLLWTLSAERVARPIGRGEPVIVPDAVGYLMEPAALDALGFLPQRRGVAKQALHERAHSPSRARLDERPTPR